MAKSRQPVVLIVSPSPEAGQRVQTLFEAAVGTFGLAWGALVLSPETLTKEAIASVKRVVFLGATPGVEVPAEKFEVWDDDRHEARVNQLVARLLGGGGAAPEPTPEPTEKPTSKPTQKEKPIVKVGRETKGRKGKGVTVVSEVPLDEAGLRELAATLKSRCGTGGGVEEDRIVIQGDLRDRVTVELERLGYRVKRAGG